MSRRATQAKGCNAVIWSSFEAVGRAIEIFDRERSKITNICCTGKLVLQDNETNFWDIFNMFALNKIDSLHIKYLGKKSKTSQRQLKSNVTLRKSLNRNSQSIVY